VRLYATLSLTSFWFLSAVLFALPHVSPVPVFARCWDTAFGLLVAGPLSIVPVLLIITRGQWRLDREGVEYRSSRGKVNVLRWNEVDYVYYGNWTTLTVRGNGRCIRLPLHAFTEPERAEAIRSLKQFLPDFELTTRPRARPARKPVGPIALLTPGTIIAFMLTAFLWTALSYLRSLIQWPVVILVGCWMWLLLGGIGSGDRSHQQRKTSLRRESAND
jgi:hypothetical protein